MILKDHECSCSNKDVEVLNKKDVDGKLVELSVRCKKCAKEFTVVTILD
jgi:hypothetical protein